MSSNNNAAGGVSVFSHKSHKLIEDSFRESNPAGNYVLGVYQVRSEQVIIGGIYGTPDSNDTKSADIFSQLHMHISELKHLYQVRSIIILGDFNCHLHKNDSSKDRILKYRTVNTIKNMMDRFDLFDVAVFKHKLQHTYHRHKAQQISSRIDIILTNIDAKDITYDTKHTIFDHTCVSAQIGLPDKKINNNMKDHILASDEFLIKASDKLTEIMSSFGINGQANENFNEAANGNIEQNNITMQEDIESINKKLNENNSNTLFLLNNIIHEYQLIHTNIAKENAKRNRNELNKQSKTLGNLIKQIKSNRITENERRELQERYTEMQQDIKNDIEAKEHASEMRIQTFYKANTGKNVPVTFSVIKEKHKKTEINKLEIDNSIITDREEINTIMQNWYQETANKDHEQTLTLTDFMNKQNINIPKITPEQADYLEQEFTEQEVQQAINDANETSASGISGQSISLFKLIFLEIPQIMTAALNQLVFVPGLMDDPDLQWIRRRKVIYIPKKTPALHPRDFRPLSMLEVLYKIPARIISKRLSTILHTVIGPNQHGFMPKRGIQEPTLMITHAIQDANKNNKPLQIISYDIEKAFDRVSHKLIVQALREFGIPEIMIMAIQKYTLVGYVQIEVNGRMGRMFVIKIGSGQGDPLSAIIYILATEPGNRALIQNTSNMQYVDEFNITMQPKFYADDNKSCLRISNAQELEELHTLYEEYTRVSGLKVNFNKSEALCINTSQRVKEIIQNSHINITENADCLGVIIGRNIKKTIEATINKINPNAIKKRIMITSTPTSTLHKAILLNRAITPIFNHMFMGLPAWDETAEKMFQDLTRFLWTSTKGGVAQNKRRLIAKNRLCASFEMGGLQINHPQDVIIGLQLNLLQRHTKKLFTGFSEIIENILNKTGRPDLDTHLRFFGPLQWKKTAHKIEHFNLIIAQSFLSMAEFLEKLENSTQSWHAVSIFGHSKSVGVNEIKYADFRLLYEKNIITTGQLLNTNELTGKLENAFNTKIVQSLNANSTLLVKLKNLLQKSKRGHDYNFNALDTPIINILIQGRNLSQIHKRLAIEERNKEIAIAPAYMTRIRDNIFVPTKEIFTQSFAILNNNLIPQKTKEISFQIINRTLWTNNKAYKSNKRNDDNCRFCLQTETVEHAILQCENYASLQWETLGDLITKYVRKTSPTAASFQLNYQNIIYNKEIENISHYIKDKNVRKTFMLLIAEMKRCIYRHRSQSESIQNSPVLEVRRIAHIISVIKKIIKYLEYLSCLKWQSAINMLIDLNFTLTENI